MGMKFIKQAGRSITKQRSDALDNVLSYLFLSEQKGDTVWEWLARDCDAHIQKAIKVFNRVPLTHFEAADVSWMYESLTSTTSYDREFFPFCDPDSVEELSRLPMQWDYTTGAYFDDAPSMLAEDIKDQTYLLTLQRHRTVPLSAVRGLFPLRAGHVLEYSQAHLLNNGTYLSSREYWQYFSGAWHVVGAPVEIDPPLRGEEVAQSNIWGSRSLALTSEYDWSVHIGFNRVSVPTVSIPTDPYSSREVFKLRDIPPGKDRREALRHWVHAHTRKGVPPNYVEKYIWPYLRGAEEFTWNGPYCKIQPSVYDLKKAKEYQAIRKPTETVGRVQ